MRDSSLSAQDGATLDSRYKRQPGVEMPDIRKKHLPDLGKQKYGAQFEMVLNDVKQPHDLRVLDYNGHNVFYNFSFSEMGDYIQHEP